MNQESKQSTVILKVQIPEDLWVRIATFHIDFKEIGYPTISDTVRVILELGLEQLTRGSKKH